MKFWSPWVVQCFRLRIQLAFSVQLFSPLCSLLLFLSPPPVACWWLICCFKLPEYPLPPPPSHRLPLPQPCSDQGHFLSSAHSNLPTSSPSSPWEFSSFPTWNQGGDKCSTWMQWWIKSCLPVLFRTDSFRNVYLWQFWTKQMWKNKSFHISKIMMAKCWLMLLFWDCLKIAIDT